VYAESKFIYFDFPITAESGRLPEIPFPQITKSGITL
jgi:hypothetical protein